MPSFDPLGLAYGLLVSGGGIYGYARSGSVPSVVAGVSFGVLAIAGSMQLATDPKNIWILLASSGTLSILMGARYYHSGKFMPAGVIATASIAMSLKLLTSKYLK